ncbi:MAG TPA: 5-(carboxyamino)imidazole ribonucleotide synthase [Gemmatimonadales bacterium]|nr:5-(carboxyamino)imidazole ribonucleotide synthase [Gemmatimonadales bacterium]
MILPGATIGVVGGGQLGRMFTIRARTMGYRVVVLEPDPRSPAGSVADHQIEAAYDDPAALAELVARCAAVTTEFENVPAEALASLEDRVRVRPGSGAVAIAQDRIAEKEAMRRAGLATAEFRPVRSGSAARAAFDELAVRSAILKTNRLGYDGKGQALVSSPDECEAAFNSLGGVPCILEERLRLECEVSVILARGDDGAVAAFPPGENRHRLGILESTVVPARIPESLANEASAMAEAVAHAIGYVGVLGVELFVAEGGRLFVNEIAPRPHNSGHYTLDACAVDQFEQQVRALCGLPLGAPRLLTPVAMVNLLGDLWAGGEPHWDRALALPGVRLTLYGKAEPRPGRKMGHLTCMAPSPDEALAGALEARSRLTDS